MKRPEIIAVDFDGTLCENKYPRIGDPKDNVISYILAKQEQGAKIILWTCRAKQELVDALVWARDHGIIFDAVNQNLPLMIATFGSDTRKVYADIYLDDRAISLEEV